MPATYLTTGSLGAVDLSSSRVVGTHGKVRPMDAVGEIQALSPGAMAERIAAPERRNAELEATVAGLRGPGGRTAPWWRGGDDRKVRRQAPAGLMGLPALRTESARVLHEGEGGVEQLVRIVRSVALRGLGHAVLRLSGRCRRHHRSTG